MEDQGTILKMHALLELTEANVPPIASSDAWETELGLIQQDEQQDIPAPLQETIDVVLGMATALA